MNKIYYLIRTDSGTCSISFKATPFAHVQPPPFPPSLLIMAQGTCRQKIAKTSYGEIVEKNSGKVVEERYWGY